MLWAVIWYWLFGIFTVADVITTKIGLACGFYEGNPLMRPLLDNIVEAKIFVMLLTMIMVLIYERHDEGNGWVPVAGVTVWTAAVVIQNVVRITGII